jgi:hypothetical protein
LRRFIDKLPARIGRPCLVAAIAWLGAGCGVPVRDGLILVSVDTLRVGALGVFGHPDAHTPAPMPTMSMPVTKKPSILKVPVRA